jgi:hypothetical protein
LLTPLVDYLIVEVRVKGEFERAAKTLARFAKRPDLWRHLRSDVDEWIHALRELRPLASSAPDLAKARELIERARSIAKVPADSGPLVHYLVASSVLQRFLATTPPPTNRDAAGAYCSGSPGTRRRHLLGFAGRHAGDRDPAAGAVGAGGLVLEEETVAIHGSTGRTAPSVAGHLRAARWWTQCDGSRRRTLVGGAWRSSSSRRSTLSLISRSRRY